MIKSFSQRNGQKPLLKKIQGEEIDAELFGRLGRR
jgi:hypothetical protein